MEQSYRGCQTGCDIRTVQNLDENISVYFVQLLISLYFIDIRYNNGMLLLLMLLKPPLHYTKIVYIIIIIKATPFYGTIYLYLVLLTYSVSH